jgi:hypothetical protein
MKIEGDGYEQLNEAIQGASFQYAPMSSKGELIDYYKETYKGKGQEGWKQHLVHDLARQTGMKSKNLERRFDPSRIDKKANKAQQEQYRELGKTLPQKKEPKNTAGKRARVSFNGEVCIPSGKKRKDDCRDRNFTITLSASQASSMKHGNFNPIFDAYGLEPGVIGSIGVYSVSVDFV